MRHEYSNSYVNPSQTYRDLQNYYQPQAGCVAGPPVPPGTPSMLTQTPAYPQVNYGYSALTHDSSGTGYYNISSGYATACSQNKQRLCAAGGGGVQPVRGTMHPSQIPQQRGTPGGFPTQTGRGTPSRGPPEYFNQEIGYGGAIGDTFNGQPGGGYGGGQQAGGYGGGQQAGGYGGGQPDFNQQLAQFAQQGGQQMRAPPQAQPRAPPQAQPRPPAPTRGGPMDAEVIIISAGSWCGYSKKMDAQIEEIIAILEPIGVRVTHVSDKDDKAAFDKHAAEHKVQGFPTSLVKRGGKVVQKMPGYKAAKPFSEAVVKHLRKSLGSPTPQRRGSPTGGGRPTPQRRGSPTGGGLPSKPSGAGGAGGAGNENVGDVVLCLSANSWCGYSKKISNQKEEMAAALAALGIELIMVEDAVDKARFDELSKKHVARGFPHTVVLSNGKKKGEIGGYMPTDAFVAKAKALHGK